MKKLFTSNILKIIAFISMFLDHTGKILEIFYVNNTTISTISYIFSIIGRITFPIIIFLLIEGFNHTSSL
ncbi:MAG: TraX family protein, partial [bacterium]|nr:TraX family protein [bacterium]